VLAVLDSTASIERRPGTRLNREWSADLKCGGRRLPEKLHNRGRDLLRQTENRHSTMAKTIKLSGREMGILRTIGFGLGVSGAELVERTQIAAEDLCDTLNTLIDIGFIEAGSMKERVAPTEFAAENFEINPSYVNDLKLALKR
jgi:predicted transcriptional regulator